MKIIINETKQTKQLSIIDPETGVDWIADFVGNTGALTDGQFVYSDEQDAYLCDQSTFDWWVKVVNDHQVVADRIAALNSVHGSDAVFEVVANVGGCDLEDYAAIVNEALNERFGAE